MEFASVQAAQAYWQAEYEFWRKLIDAEVTRERLNRGVETIEIDLYQIPKSAPTKGTDFVGKTHIGHALYYGIATTGFDKEGNKVLKIKLFVP